MFSRIPCFPRSESGHDGVLVEAPQIWHWRWPNRRTFAELLAIGCGAAILPASRLEHVPTSFGDRVRPSLLPYPLHVFYIVMQ